MGRTRNITIKDIEECLKQINMPKVEYLGNGLYRLPEGIITGGKGLELFDKAVRNHIERQV